MRAALMSLLGCLAVAVSPTASRAQTPVVVVAGSRASTNPAGTSLARPAPPCTYVDCALRLEPGRGLVRGASGPTIGTFGFFHSSAVDTLLRGPDSAAAYARSYRSERHTGTVFLAAGWALGLGSTVYASATHRGVGINFIGLAAMTLATIPASHHFSHASRDISRSVWWYNAAVVDSLSKR